jgi:PKHD-type hydroxylase
MQPFVQQSSVALDVPKSRVTLRGIVAERRLTEAECNRVVLAARAFPVAPAQVVGNPHLPRFRMGDVRKVMPEGEDALWVYRQLLDIAEAENEAHFLLKLDGIARPPEYVEYVPGNGHFDWHDDYSHEGDHSPRKLTVIFQLSSGDDYEGGDFQAWGVPVETLSRQRGSVLVLPSFVPHRVTPVTRGMRRILVAWISGPRLC